MGCILRIDTEKHWHRFWQHPDGTRAIWIASELLDKPLFGRIFSVEEFLERVFRRYQGVVFIEMPNGIIVASIYGWLFVRHLGFDPDMFCREDEYDVKSLISTIITGKEVR